MLKHDRTRPRKKSWTMRYLRWLQEQQFDHPAHQIALQEMVEAVRVGREWVDRLERTIKEFVSGWSLEPLVRALQTLRGVDLIVAATFATEVGDVSRRAQSTHGLPRPSAERTIDGSLSGAAASPRPTTAVFAICPHVHPAASLIRNEPDQLVRTVDIWRRTRARTGERRRASAQLRCSASGGRTDCNRLAHQFNLSNDPNLVDKLQDVVGLHVNPPEHAILLSVDEKS